MTRIEFWPKKPSPMLLHVTQSQSNSHGCPINYSLYLWRHKLVVLSCLSKVDNKKKKFTMLFLNNKPPRRSSLQVFQGGLSVAMVTFTNGLGSVLKSWLLHQVIKTGCNDPSKSKCWKLYWATLRVTSFERIVTSFPYESKSFRDT